MSLAAKTREAVRSRPELYDALRAGVVNYTAAADSLDVDGDREAIATALRRFAADLDGDDGITDRSITVRLHSRIECVDSKALLAVDGAGIELTGTDGDDHDEIELDDQTVVQATGDVDARLLSSVLNRLRIAGVPVAAAGVAGETMVLLVSRRDGPTAVQLVEAAAESA